jgi:hypothetical protein
MVSQKVEMNDLTCEDLNQKLHSSFDLDGEETSCEQFRHVYLGIYGQNFIFDENQPEDEQSCSQLLN